MVLAGGVAWATQDDGTTEAGSTTTATAAPTTTATTATSSTSTTSSTTTTTSTSTTTSTTTTTTLPAETVEDFVEQFAAALDAGDIAFVAGRLHPVVYEQWGVDLCTAWVEREIMQLSNYTLVRINEGPVDRTISTPGGSVTVPDSYATDISFVFQGQAFDQEGGFALVDGVMYWLGQCR